MLQSECVLLFLRSAGYESDSVIMLLRTSKMACCTGKLECTAERTRSHPRTPRLSAALRHTRVCSLLLIKSSTNIVCIM